MKEKITAYLKDEHNKVFIFLLCMGLFLMCSSFFFSPAKEIFEGLWDIFTTPSILLKDYFEFANLGAGLFNSGLLTCVLVIIKKISKGTFNGISLASILICTGFAFFGKNIANAWPILLGVFLYAKYRGDKFSKHINTAFFGTTMGPLVSELYTYQGWSPTLGIILAISVGIFIGFILPRIASFTMTVHQGYVLYNVGVAAGMIVVLAVSIMRVFNFEFTSHNYWGHEYTNLLTIMFGAIFVVFILLGTIIKKKSFVNAFKMCHYSGRAITDFVVREGFESTLVNMGLLGILSLGFVRAVGAPINGPVLGAIITIVGFGGFGNTLKNVAYIFVGGLIGHLCGFWNFATDASAILGILFATGIVPIGGHSGAFWGMLAGFIHVFIVKNVSHIHAGLTLYSNGFAEIFDVVLLLPLIEAYYENPIRRKRRQKKYDEGEGKENS